MEINLSRIEKSSETVWKSDDEQVLGHLKSYTCSFCKRGFSNAQALGGHMNIHRKDRAKLKEAFDETLLSMDVAKKDPFDHPQASADENLDSQKDCSPKRPPWVFSIEDDDDDDDDDATCRGKEIGTGQGLRKLPFFVETPWMDHDLEASSADINVSGHVEKAMQWSTDGSSQAELDLELRLGLDPHKNSTVSTKEHF